MSVVDQLVEEAEQIREARSERAALLHSIDGQLARVDAAVRALRGQYRHDQPRRTSGQQQKPSEKAIEKVRAGLREHGQTSQKDLAELIGLSRGVVMGAKKVLLERGEIEVIQPRKRKPEQATGRISPEMRLL